MISFFVVLGLFTKFAVVDSFTPDGDTVTIPKTTRAPIPAKPVAPKVESNYTLTETGKINDFETGFIIDLPRINSDKTGAEKINADIDTLKEDIKAKYVEAYSVGLNSFEKKYEYSYTTFSNDEIVFISIYKTYETPNSELEFSNTYYVYEFNKDNLITDYRLPDLFGLKDITMLDIINNKLDAIGAAQIESMTGVEFFVNKEGRLSAQVLIDDGSGGKIPEIVGLTSKLSK